MLDASEAAKLADTAFAEYRNRFPVREPELDDEESTGPSDPNTDTPSVKPTKKDVQ